MLLVKSEIVDNDVRINKSGVRSYLIVGLIILVSVKILVLAFFNFSSPTFVRQKAGAVFFSGARTIEIKLLLFLA